MKIEKEKEEEENCLTARQNRFKYDCQLAHFPTMPLTFWYFSICNDDMQQIRIQQKKKNNIIIIISFERKSFCCRVCEAT